MMIIKEEENVCYVYQNAKNGSTRYYLIFYAMAIYLDLISNEVGF